MFTFNTLGTWQSGRLGNQMFQFAFMKSISTELNIDFKLPLSVYNNEEFIIDGLFYIEDFFTEISRDYIYEEYYEKSMSYYNVINDLPAHTNINFNGFYQSEKYFKSNCNEIKNMFEFKSNIKYISDKIYCDSIKRNSLPVISIHIRRTDYIQLKDKHVNLEIGYYDSAIKIMKELIGNFNIIIFSDDIEWCKENLKYENIIYYSSHSSYIDMCLMSLCDHNIIANSTFGWWGAYLNKNPHKLIISPLKWYHLPFDNPDINLDSWITI